MDIMRGYEPRVVGSSPASPVVIEHRKGMRIVWYATRKDEPQTA